MQTLQLQSRATCIGARDLHAPLAVILDEAAQRLQRGEAQTQRMRRAHAASRCEVERNACRDCLARVDRFRAALANTWHARCDAARTAGAERLTSYLSMLPLV